MGALKVAYTRGKSVRANPLAPHRGEESARGHSRSWGALDS